MIVYLLVLGRAPGKVGGCGGRVRLLHHIGSGVNSKADKASHVERLDNAVPPMPPEPLIVPGHVLAGGYDVRLIPLHTKQHHISFASNNALQVYPKYTLSTLSLAQRHQCQLPP